MPKRKYTRKKRKYVTKRSFPFMLMKHAEPKHVELERKAQELNGAGADIIPLNEIDRGTTVGSRNGNEVQLTGFYFRGYTSKSTAALTPTDSTYMVRVVIYTPREMVDAAMDTQPGDLIDKEKYIIWKDILVPVPWANSIRGNTFVLKHRFKPYMKVIWNSATNDDFVKGPLYMNIGTDSPSTNNVKYSIQGRTYFRDI